MENSVFNQISTLCVLFPKLKEPPKSILPQIRVSDPILEDGLRVDLVFTSKEQMKEIMDILSNRLSEFDDNVDIGKED